MKITLSSAQHYHRSIIFLGLFLVIGALVGCSSKPSNNNDQLVVAISTFSEGTFLPWNGSTGRKIYLDTIYDYLTYIDPETDEQIPGLAERWDVSADGKTHTLWLRSGIHFQDGWGELTAADVAFTLEKVISPESISGASSLLRATIANVEAPSKYKVVISLRHPDIRFVRGALSNGSIVPIVSSKYFAEVGEKIANENPIGTGAYRLIKHEKDVSMTLQIRPDSEHLWRVQPDFKNLKLINSPEEYTRLAMLKTGEADLAPINFDSMRAAKESGLNIIFIPNNWTPQIRLGGLSTRFQNKNTPWNDHRVRVAMNLAVNKEKIIEFLFHGHAQPAGTDFYAAETAGVPPYPFDPETAKKLLQEAGYADGFKVKIKTFTTSPGAELPIVAQAVALYWRDIGIDASIEPTNWISLRGAWTTGNATDFVWTHRGIPFPTPLPGLQISSASRSLFATYVDAQSDINLGMISKSLDLEERKALLFKQAQHLRDQAAAVFIAHVDEPYGASKKIAAWPSITSQATNLDMITRRETTSP